MVRPQQGSHRVVVIRGQVISNHAHNHMRPHRMLRSHGVTCEAFGALVPPHEMSLSRFMTVSQSYWLEP